MPFHKNRSLTTASTKMMHRLGVRNEINLPVVLSETHAPVKILAVQKVTLVKFTDIIQSLATYEHARPRHGFHLDRRRRKRLHAKVIRREQPRPPCSEPRQPESPHEGTPGCRNSAPPACLLGTVRIREKPTYHSCTFVNQHGAHHFAQRIRIYHAIRIQKQQKTTRGNFSAHIACDRKTDILSIQNQLEPRVLR